MYDFLHIQKAILTLPSLLKVAIDVSEGMKYLHQKDIIHRDIKAANLLMDEKGVSLHCNSLAIVSSLMLSNVHRIFNCCAVFGWVNQCMSSI